MRKTLFSTVLAIIFITACLFSGFAAAPVIEADTTVIFEEDFSNGPGEWTPLGGQGTLSIDSRFSKKGSTSLNVKDRVHSWNGPSLDMTDILEPGQQYTFLAWVHHDDAETNAHIVNLNLKYETKNDGEQYQNIGSVEATYGGWARIEEKFTVPDNATAEYIYFETDEDISFNIDAITVTGLKKSTTTADENAGAVEIIYDFEEGFNGWKSRGDAKIERSSNFSFAGSYSLYVSERNKFWNTATIKISSIIQNEVSYEYSAYVMYNGKQYENEQDFMLMLQYNYNGQEVYEPIDVKTLQKGNWSKLSGEKKLPEGASNVYLYVQNTDPEDEENPTVNDTLAHYIDNVVIEDSTLKNQKQLANNIIIAVLIAFAFLMLATIIMLFMKKMNETNTILATASRDSMTDTYNRNSYEIQMAHLENCPEECRKLFITVCDVNFLKHINDNYGHQKGDDAIYRCAKSLLEAIGKKGQVYRTGGDEFVCITKTDLSEKIKQSLMAESQNYKGYPFAVASGTSSYNPAEDGPVPDVKLILARSDKEMYKDKQALKEKMQKFI